MLTWADAKGFYFAFFRHLSPSSETFRRDPDGINAARRVRSLYFLSIASSTAQLIVRHGHLRVGLQRYRQTYERAGRNADEVVEDVREGTNLVPFVEQGGTEPRSDTPSDSSIESTALVGVIVPRDRL